MFPTYRLIVCLAAAVVLGCSSHYEDAWSQARPQTYSSTGTVVHRGRPLMGALVNFAIEMPDAKRPEVIHSYQAIGFTGPDGTFQLKTFREADGAVAGTHRVRISMPDLTSPDDRRAKAPPSLISNRYASFDSSGLMAEVTPAGPNRFEFTLSE
jgi:hypothetical protein